MKYLCAKCQREIRRLRTKGEKINVDFFCTECAHDNYNENLTRTEQLLDALIKNDRK